MEKLDCEKKVASIQETVNRHIEKYQFPYYDKHRSLVGLI